MPEILQTGLAAVGATALSGTAGATAPTAKKPYRVGHVYGFARGQPVASRPGSMARSTRWRWATCLDEIVKQNDLELFDLAKDPHEMTNLAAEPHRHTNVILRMNALLNRLIAREGVNDGRFLPTEVRPR
jgi:hypothetical protein